MNRFILSKSMLCLFLVGMLYNVVGAKAQSIELSLLSKFAGATWYNAEGSVVTSGWTNKLVTNTDPAVTIQAPEGKNVMGWYTKASGRWPALQAGNVFTVRVPQGYEFTGYTLTTQATTASNKSTFTYTTAEGQTESVTQQTSDSKVIVEGLHTSEIIIDLTNYRVSGTHGIAISGFDVTVQKVTPRQIYVKAEVAGLEANNPNTHFGNVRLISESGDVVTANLKRSENPVALSLVGLQAPTVDFTRAYRGFDFQGYYVGEQELGKSFELTEALEERITEENPLVAKFITTEDVTLFGDDAPASYRIPAIGKTNTGRLIAVSDYRYSLDDIGRYNYGQDKVGIDLVIRTSDDNGKTWSDIKTIAKGSCERNTDDCAYGDAAIAVVGEKVLVMAAAGDVMFSSGSATAHNRAVRILSEDNGVTWTKQDISGTLFLGDDATIKNGYTSFFGSGRLAVDENYNGTGKARIYGALLLKKASSTGNYVIYTDDLGLTWNILGGSQDPIANQDEPKVEILPSGQILLSVRRNGGRQFNVFTYTDKATNAGNWDTNVNGCGNGGSNTCNGEPFVVDAKNAEGKAVKLLLQSQPKGGGGLYDRRDVTIWYKEITDATYTSAQIAADWTQGLQVSTQQSAYSAMALQNDGKIAFFFEEAPCYGDDQGKGYCMVYTPLTIENITKGNYFAPNTDLTETKTVKVTLTDAQGNVYTDVVESVLNTIASTLATKYPFITLGDNVNVGTDGANFTYANTVTLPFKVSNSETTIWHNIYWPANTNSNGYPIYISASSAGDTNIPKVTADVVYGNCTYNTADKADNINWAVYNVDNGFTFKFKNKLTGKFIQVTSVASGNNQNVKYVDEANATSFELVPDAGSYHGDYALKASVEGTVGYLCSTSAGYGYATHYNGNGHQGAWLKFVEAPDFNALINEVNTALDFVGTGLGKYTLADAKQTTFETAETAMQNSGSVKLNDLNNYKTVLEGATINKPVDGQYFRVAYDYGGNVGKLYMQSTASNVKGLQFTNEKDNASVWLYYDGSLYSYRERRCLREVNNDRGLSDTKTDVSFSASTRAKGKYNITCTSYLHANTNGTTYYTDHCSGNSCAQHDFILEEVVMRTDNVVSTIGEHKMGTFYANEAMMIPSGINAYVATESPVMKDGEGYITMTEITEVIPAQTGVVICGEPGTYTFEPAETEVEPVTGNMLRGYADVFEYESVVLPTDATIYVLAVEDDKVGFYRKESNFKVYNNKAYLQVPTRSNVRSLYFNFNGNMTGIETLQGNDQPATIYDLQGRRLTNSNAKGFYIINGNKVIIK